MIHCAKRIKFVEPGGDLSASEARDVVYLFDIITSRFLLSKSNSDTDFLFYGCRQFLLAVWTPMRRRRGSPELEKSFCEVTCEPQGRNFRAHLVKMDKSERHQRIAKSDVIYQESEALSRAVVAISIGAVIAIRYRIGKDGFGEKVYRDRNGADMTVSAS